MPIRYHNGQLPGEIDYHAFGPAIDRVYDEAKIAYAHRALPIAIEILKGFVPIDTHALKDSIVGRVEGTRLHIEVQNIDLDYPDKTINARRLSLILELGRGKGGSLLHRSQSNKYPGTEKGRFTEGWYAKASHELAKRLEPIARELLANATREVFRILSNGR